ncbi:MAG: hypothetical protein K5697_06875 [Lachnospiraceae bacterium]|nr:hypothetical protein [Lachnospiraceae bacterium]
MKEYYVEKKDTQYLQSEQVKGGEEESIPDFSRITLRETDENEAEEKRRSQIGKIEEELPPAYGTEHNVPAVTDYVLKEKDWNQLRQSFNVLQGERGGKHSGEFKRLWNAFAGVMKLQEKEKYDDADLLAFMNLGEACTHYLETHAGRSGAAIARRKEEAGKIRGVIDRGFSACASKYSEVTETLTEKEFNERKEGAGKNVSRLADYYSAFSMKVGADLIATSEEKLRRRWNVLKSCERDIRIYRRAHLDDKDRDTKESRLVQEYFRLQKQIVYLDALKSQGGHGMLFENRTSDQLKRNAYRHEGKALPPESVKMAGGESEGLSGEQLSRLSEIDTWVVRNFNNGGYMAYFKGRSDRSDFIHTLLSLSKRERLYIYYLVEKNERLNPTMEGFGASQTDYKPSVDAFKDRMVANKLKFYSRFSGGYVYWAKLKQAMAISQRCRPMLEAAAKNSWLAKKEDERKQDNIIEDPIIEEDKVQLTDIQKKQKKHLQELYRALKNGKDLLEALEKEKDEKERTAKQQQLADIRSTAANALRELQKLDRTIEQKSFEEIRSSAEQAKVKKTPAKTDVKAYLGDAPQDIGDFVMKGNNLLAEFKLGISDEMVESIGGILAPGAGSLVTLGSLINVVFGAMAFYDSCSDMGWTEFTQSGLGVLVSVGKLAQKGAKTIAAFKDVSGTVMDFLTGKLLLRAMVVVDTGMLALKSTVMLRDEYHAAKAAGMAASIIKKKRGQGERKEYERKLLLLQDKVDDKKLTTLGTSAVLTGVTIASLFVCPPLVPVLAAVGLVGGIVSKAIGKRQTRSIKYGLFDRHFDIDSAVDSLIRQKKIPEPVDDETRDELKSQLRRRVAADLGYVSPSDAAAAFAGQYAAYLLRNANAGGADSDYYIHLIKSFGLTYRYDGVDSKKNRPSAETLKKKLCGC